MPITIPLRFQIFAHNGSLVNNNNGTWTFTPEKDFNGRVNLFYNISDGRENTETDRGYESFLPNIGNSALNSLQYNLSSISWGSDRPGLGLVKKDNYFYISGKNENNHAVIRKLEHEYVPWDTPGLGGPEWKVTEKKVNLGGIEASPTDNFY